MIAMYQRSHLISKIPGRWRYYPYLFLSEKETERQRDSCPRSLSYWEILISSPEKSHACVCPPVCMGHVDPYGRSPAKNQRASGWMMEAKGAWVSCPSLSSTTRACQLPISSTCQSPSPLDFARLPFNECHIGLALRKQGTRALGLNVGSLVRCPDVNLSSSAHWP